MASESNLNSQVVLSQEKAEDILNTPLHSAEDPVNSFLLPIKHENLSIEFLPSKRKATSRININIQGELCVSAVEELKQRILGVITAFDSLHFKLQPVQQIDVAAIQFFFLLKRFSAGNGKTLSVYAEFSAEMTALLGCCGLTEVFNNSNQKS